MTLVAFPTISGNESQRRRSAISALRPSLAAAFAAFLLVVFALLLHHAMIEKLDHDEHQFIASAVLFARNGMLPYRDYAYFHMPYQVFIYGTLFKFSDHLLLTARLFCTACCFATVSLLFFIVMRLFQPAGRVRAACIAAAMVTLLLLNPLFIATSCRSWNHDVPTFLLLAAMLMIRHAVKAAARRQVNALDPAATALPVTLIASSLAAGLLMGIAVGVRLTFAPPALAFLAAVIIPASLSRRSRWLIACSYLAGLSIALIPAAILCAIAPSQFYFGNFTYATLNTASRFVTHYEKSMTPLGKLRFIAVDVIFVYPLTVILLVLLVITLDLRRRLRSRALDSQPADAARLSSAPTCRRYRDERIFLQIVGLAVLAASIAPTPLYLMYFYTPIVLVILWLSLLAAPLFADDQPHRQAAKKWSTALIVAVCLSLPTLNHQYRISHVLDEAQWVTLRTHRTGDELRHLAGDRTTILTFCPLIALEGREAIFRELTTGPFGYRVCLFLSDEDEERYSLIDADDVLRTYRSRPHVAILTGREGSMDAELLKQFSAEHLNPHPLSGDLTLWTNTPNIASTQTTAPLINPAR